jgi:hypothetical protein
MSGVDTSAETIRGGVVLLRASMTTLLHSERMKMADMIEALAAERDAAQAQCADRSQWIGNCMKALADRDRLAAEVEKMRAALQAARQFIRNGVEFGFIRMPDPDTPDSAHDTLPMIESALAAERDALRQDVDALRPLSLRCDRLAAEVEKMRAHIADMHNRVRHEFSAEVEAAADKAFKGMSGIAALAASEPGA